MTKKVDVNEWFGNLSFVEMEKIFRVSQFDFSPDDGYQEFLDFCEDEWNKLDNKEKFAIYIEHEGLSGIDVGLQASELMIGDWVADAFNPTPFQVKNIETDNDGHFRVGFIEGDCLRPILITHQILVANGFTSTEIRRYDLDSNWCLLQNATDYSFSETMYGGNNVFRPVPIFRIEYVHELQHCMRMAGIKKEVVL